jgi:O-antigen ligase
MLKLSRVSATVTTREIQRPFGGRSDLGVGAIALSAGAAGLAAGAAVSLGPAALAMPLALAACAFLVREPLALLTLFLYIGLFKDQGVVEAIPFDLTVALGVLLVCVCFFRWAAGRVRSIPVGIAAPLLVIGGMLVLSLGWTPSPEYGGEKAWRFVTLTLLATVAPFFLVEQQGDLRRYLSWTLAVGLFAAILTMASPPTDGDRFTIGSAANTIGVSHLLCTAALILLVGALTDLLSARGWTVATALALLGVAAAVGSRGPLLSLTVALATTAAVWLTRTPRKVLPVLLVLGIGAALLPFVSLPEGSSQRLEEAVRDPVASLESDARYTTFGQAVGLIERDPLVGIGAGGFESVGTLDHPPESYPHNLFLETWSELGLAAAVVLIGSVVAVLVGLWRGAWLLPPGPACGLLYVVMAVLLFNLLAAQVSGDLNQNRTFWSSLGLAWLTVQYGVPAPRRGPFTGEKERDA